MTALCPFHEDKNPSFAFNRTSGRWCCFAGCGKGSAFDYLMQTSGKSFKDALLEVGASGSGKTQTHQRIAEFSNIGDCFSGLTGSRTGLAYALVEHKQKGWQVKIGRYPANSRKLLAVDEVQFISEWDLRTLSKGVEEGFIQIDRVQSKGYESQTRLILIAYLFSVSEVRSQDEAREGMGSGAAVLKW